MKFGRGTGCKANESEKLAFLDFTLASHRSESGHLLLLLWLRARILHMGMAGVLRMAGRA